MQLRDYSAIGDYRTAYKTEDIRDWAVLKNYAGHEIICNGRKIKQGQEFLAPLCDTLCNPFFEENTLMVRAIRGGDRAGL